MVAIFSQASPLFRHVSVEKAQLYRSILKTFAVAKDEYRLPLRPEEVLQEAHWEESFPLLEEIQEALLQLTAWGNLESQPDMARMLSLEDYYRGQFLYRLSRSGEAVEEALHTFEMALKRKGELQAVALEDIRSQLAALLLQAREMQPDSAKVHALLRDIVAQLDNLSKFAQVFMADVARAIDLQQGDVLVVMAFKHRLLEYLERFIHDLVGHSSVIAQGIRELQPSIMLLLHLAAHREMRDAAPEMDRPYQQALSERVESWSRRWQGLSRWFMGDGHARSQSDLLRHNARSAIPQLLRAVAALNDRRSGRSVRFPRQTGHPFHGKLDTWSSANWTGIPRQTGHPVQRKLDTGSAPNWTV